MTNIESVAQAQIIGNSYRCVNSENRWSRLFKSLID